MIIQLGRFDGTLNANSIPVTKAEPSLIVTGPLIRYFWMIHSKNKHATEAIIKTRKASSPK